MKKLQMLIATLGCFFFCVRGHALIQSVILISTYNFTADLHFQFQSSVSSEDKEMRWPGLEYC